MLKKPEPTVDTFAQVVHGSYARRKEELMRKRESFLRKQGAGRRARKGSEEESPKKKGQEEVHLDGANGSKLSRVSLYITLANVVVTDWVLFDPSRGWPPTIGCEPPSLYEHYAQYVPGNRKIVAYNVESYAISLRRTPATFRGCEVQYLKTGPKLVKVKPKTQVPQPIEQTKIDELSNGRQMIECS